MRANTTGSVKEKKGKGTGEWTDLTRPYMLSSNPDIKYSVWSGYFYFDSCARRHYAYEVMK